MPQRIVFTLRNYSWEKTYFSGAEGLSGGVIPQKHGRIGVLQGLFGLLLTKPELFWHIHS